MSGKCNSSRRRVWRPCALSALLLSLCARTFAQEAAVPPSDPATLPPPSAEATPTPAGAPDFGEAMAKHLQGLFNRVRGAVVRVEARNGPFDFVGTGFFIDPSGALLTNYPVGGESTDIVVTYGDMKFPAKRLLADPKTGIALLKVEGGPAFPFLLPGASAALQPATPVMLVGYPLSLPVSPSFGLVASFDIQAPNCRFVTSCIRASVPVQSGEAGSPLVNMRGEVIGIVIQGQENHAGLFALPIEAAEKVRRDYTRFGEIRHGQVGIVMDKAFVEGDAPAVIAKFVKDSPAATSGLQPGDVVKSLAGKAIGTPADLLDASYYVSPGDQVPLIVDRQGTEKSFLIQATAPKAEKQEEANPFQPNPGGLMHTAQ